MKFFRFGPVGQEKPGAMDKDGLRRDISAHVSDLSGANLSPEMLQSLSQIDLSTCPIVPDGERYGACVGRIGNFIGVGVNYADHALEAGFDLPSEPILFNKAPSCAGGPNDDIRLPPGSQKTDWEIELAIVIGGHFSYGDEVSARNAISGFCICNDLSERAYQMPASSLRSSPRTRPRPGDCSSQHRKGKRRCCYIAGTDRSTGAPTPFRPPP